MHKAPFFLVIAIPAPCWECFDYLPPENVTATDLQPGMRVKVPFGSRSMVGFLLEVKTTTTVPANKLKVVEIIIDVEPVLTTEILKLTQWASHYYQYPLGEVLSAALPALLCQGKPAELKQAKAWRLTTAGLALQDNDWKRSSAQAALWHYLVLQKNPVLDSELKAQNFSSAARRALVEKGFVESCFVAVDYEFCTVTTTAPFVLNTEQQTAYETIIQQLNTFQAFLLDGVTGSGKTEVYLHVIQDILKNQQQVLVLVPEIGLTPQTVARFKQRFNSEIVVLHSNLNDNERLQAWLRAKQGAAKIIIGTRSALFTPLPDLGLIILDEEHDVSFKQQEGFRYSARDLALVRARLKNIPVILGSATPSLETLHNARQQRYQHLKLRQRAGLASLPEMVLIDARKQTLVQGVAPSLLLEVKACLEREEQVLLFLNRRGYAPVLRCHDCGWIAGCVRCDARLTLHTRDQRLHCHHCDTARSIIKVCPECHCQQLFPLGIGTQRLEQVLQETFPTTDIIRIDRDTVRRKNELEDVLNKIQQGGAKILLGTQMLAKGHHFPNVTLVGILDMDNGFFSADFRAPERMAQLVLQVAGRAGRAEKTGKVLLQTYHPQHPLLQQLLPHDYTAFAEQILSERQQTRLPPYAFLALLRAQHTVKEKALCFLKQVREIIQKNNNNAVNVLGPIPALMEKRAGFYRAQLLLRAENRSALQKLLSTVMPQIVALKKQPALRWNLDVDPQEMF